MTEKRYESDLTRKEKRQLEWQKIKNMPKRKLPGYIWEYYKAYIAGLVVFIVFCGMIAQMIYRSQFDTVLSVMLLNGGAGDSEAMTQDFREYLNDDNKYHELSIDSSMVLVGDGGQADYMTIVRLLTLVGAHDLDVLIAPKSKIEQYEDMEGTLVPMKELLTEEQIEAYGDDVEEYSLHLGENERMQKYLMGVGEDCYLAVFSFSDYIDNAKTFIRFMKEESHE